MNFRTGFIAALVVATGACAPATQQMRNNGTEQQRATVLVQNDSWSDVALYVVRGTQRWRLGNVTGLSKAEFPIPKGYIFGVSDVTLQADPIGSRDEYVSPPIQVYSGAQIWLRLANQLSMSSYAVYDRP